MKKVLIAGGTGLIGTRLSTLFLEKGYSVGILSRSRRKGDSVTCHHWNIAQGEIDKEILNYDILVNLAGAGIADRRWSKKRKQIIVDSRVKSNDLLYRTFRDGGKKLQAVLNASAVGYYGNSGEEIVDEDYESDLVDFLTQVCRDWEQSALKLKDLTSKHSIVRIGTVLSSKGGALPKMSASIKYGIASYLGDGRQWMSWIHIDDLCEMILFLLEKDHNGGIFNGVSPQPVRNKEFTQILRSILNKYALTMPTPGIMLRLIFGEMADLLLHNNRVSSEKIVSLGFQFRYGQLADALLHICSRDG